MTDAYSKAAVGYERIREVLETNHVVQDLPGAQPCSAFKGKIEFEHVSFRLRARYAGAQGYQSHDRTRTGGRAGGPDRRRQDHYHQPDPALLRSDSGVVKIDGQDIRSYTQKSLRQQISFVLQETLLFHGPIWHNIAYGKPEAAATRSCARPRWPTPTSSSRRCRRATTRWSANAA